MDWFLYGRDLRYERVNGLYLVIDLQKYYYAVKKSFLIDLVFKEKTVNSRS